MAKSLLHLSCLLLMLCCLPARPAAAQANTAYTSGNTILLTLEGITRPFTFISDDLLVNYNQATQKLVCRLSVSTLHPAGDTAAPPAMAYEVLYGATHPELYLEIDLPADQLSAPALYQQSVPRVTTVRLQGVSNETVIPVAFTPDNQALIFSTSFDLLLGNFRASVPARYAPLLTGRLFVNIRNARWTKLQVH